MVAQVFERFAEMVDRLPAKAVSRAVQLQRQMFEDDMAHKRTLPMVDVRSIAAFDNFLQNPAEASNMVVPFQHLSFYRKTVKRMVQDGALAYEAGEQFEHAFTAAMMKAA
jgi:hypothetical protein